MARIEGKRPPAGQRETVALDPAARGLWEAEAVPSEAPKRGVAQSMIGVSPRMQHLASSEKVAPTESTVLILGESSTGKEMVATAIASRAAAPTDRLSP